MSGDKGISAFPESDNLFKWVGTIEGAQGTVGTHCIAFGVDVVVEMLWDCFLVSGPSTSKGPVFYLPGVLGPQVPTVPGVPGRIPLPAPAGQVPHLVLSPQRGQPGLHLPGHLEGQVVSALRRTLHPAVHPELAWR